MQHLLFSTVPYPIFVDQNMQDHRRGDARFLLPLHFTYIRLKHLTRKSELFLWFKRFVERLSFCLIDEISMRCRPGAFSGRRPSYSRRKPPASRTRRGRADNPPCSARKRPCILYRGRCARSAVYWRLYPAAARW